MSQFAYYLIIIALGAGNLALAGIAYLQRDKQIRGNQLRETQVELAMLRNEMAERRMEYLRLQVELLKDIHDALGPGKELERDEGPDTVRAARPSRRAVA